MSDILLRPQTYPKGAEDGQQDWERPYGCNSTECGTEITVVSHLHCGGPLRGQQVYFRKMDPPGLALSRRKPRIGAYMSGVGEVKIHWHYEDCMIEVDAPNGERLSLCPSTGDTVLMHPQNTPRQYKMNV